ncbi:MAG: metallophosphoesterase [Deltaproteobacteria bacterium]|nr:metallophosphoesterase [Deltaproteobacteria bacterium]MBW2359523.1 metallophosphoesterase [Deltaproteobacteria bacterium]
MKRPIFVGDVQGCADELAELLARATDVFGEGFELWSVGDLVNRGPDNLGVLRQMRELVDAGRGQLVLGNHEINLLRVAAGQRPLGPYDSIADVLEASDADDWIDWLRRRPLVLSGELGRGRFAMVHAAVHPGWRLPELERRAQAAAARLAASRRRDAERFLAGDRAGDPDLDVLHRLTACRSVTRGGSWSSQLPELAGGAKYQPWHVAWSAQRHDYGVVYGHWALQGLHVGPGVRGLDTGCVHHGRGHDGFLTAWLPQLGASDAFAVPDAAFWQVPARRAYYAQKDEPKKRAVGDVSD